MSSTPSGATSPDTIVLIHGMWLTPRSWENWVHRYMAAGYRVMTPAWPGVEVEVEELRRDPAPLTRLDTRRVVDHYDAIVREMERPPILMGHSIGGVVVQVLLQRGLGAAGVAINSVGVRGVLHLPLSMLRATWPVLKSFGNWNRAVPFTPEQFHYALTNKTSAEESLRAYERYYVPAAARLLFETLLANVHPGGTTRVDFCKDNRAPLLLIAGGADHITPPALVQANAGHYRRSTAITSYHQFPGRSHFTIGQEGWEQVADYALEWALEATALRTSEYLQSKGRSGEGP